MTFIKPSTYHYNAPQGPTVHAPIPLIINSVALTDGGRSEGTNPSIKRTILMKDWLGEI